MQPAHTNDTYTVSCLTSSNAGHHASSVCPGAALERSALQQLDRRHRSTRTWAADMLNCLTRTWEAILSSPTRTSGAPSNTTAPTAACQETARPSRTMSCHDMVVGDAVHRVTVTHGSPTQYSGFHIPIGALRHSHLLSSQHMSHLPPFSAWSWHMFERSLANKMLQPCWAWTGSQHRSTLLPARCAGECAAGIAAAPGLTAHCQDQQHATATPACCEFNQAACWCTQCSMQHSRCTHSAALGAPAHTVDVSINSIHLHTHTTLSP